MKKPEASLAGYATPGRVEEMVKQGSRPEGPHLLPIRRCLVGAGSDRQGTTEPQSPR